MLDTNRKLEELQQENYKLKNSKEIGEISELLKTNESLKTKNFEEVINLKKSNEYNLKKIEKLENIVSDKEVQIVEQKFNCKKLDSEINLKQIEIESELKRNKTKLDKKDEDIQKIRSEYERKLSAEKDSHILLGDKIKKLTSENNEKDKVIVQ